MRIIAVIPARLGSKRLPGKPLRKVAGRPLIEWVYHSVCNYDGIDDVIVATDHSTIATCVTSFGGKVEMTRSDHECGTDRVAEVAARHRDADVVLNIQGDQPFVTGEMIDALVAPFRGMRAKQPAMTTLACLLPENSACHDPNTVKVVCALDGTALYFSRAAIPHASQRKTPVYQHVGVYAFQRDFLNQYASLPRTPLECAERLEQLRALEHGHRIVVCCTTGPVLEINTPADLRRFRRRFARVPN